jgi:hypothetical protein
LKHEERIQRGSRQATEYRTVTGLLGTVSVSMVCLLWEMEKNEKRVHKNVHKHTLLKCRSMNFSNMKRGSSRPAGMSDPLPLSDRLCLRALPFFFVGGDGCGGSSSYTPATPH